MIGLREVGADRADARQAHADGRLRGPRDRRRSPPSQASRIAAAAETLASGPADHDPVPLGVVDQRLRRIEPHRLGVEQRRAERGRVVELEPARRIDQQREADRVALGEPERGECPYLVVDVVGSSRPVIPLPLHALRTAGPAAARCAAAERFDPIARRSWSASDGVKSAAATASCISCSWNSGMPSVRSSDFSSRGWG